MKDTPRLLVIDDEIGICEGIQRALEPEGYQVEIALDGFGGLELVRQNGFDLVLLDVKMPSVSGLDLIPLIHQADPEVICIIITGYATVEMAVSAIKQGAYDFLTKPFSVDTLLLAVNQGLERRSLALEAGRAARMEAEARQLAEEKDRLQELDLAKRQFIRLVTHELKAPVAAVENYLNLILQGYVPAEKQGEILEQCISRTREERSLIDDLLELGHLEVLESIPATEVSPAEELEKVLFECQEQIKQKGLDVSVEVEDGIPDINANQEQIKSLWCNLIGNAVKYTPEGGRISAGLKVRDGMLQGWVQDTGIGIPAEEQGRLFGEFFRATNAKRAGIPGSGLGLVIVKRVLEGLGGEISVASEPGRGSEFRFSIPLQTNRPAVN